MLKSGSLVYRLVQETQMSVSVERRSVGTNSAVYLPNAGRKLPLHLGLRNVSLKSTCRSRLNVFRDVGPALNAECEPRSVQDRTQTNLPSVTQVDHALSAVRIAILTRNTEIDITEHFHRHTRNRHIIFCECRSTAYRPIGLLTEIVGSLAEK
jgi:hypothetical protein